MGMLGRVLRNWRSEMFLGVFGVWDGVGWTTVLVHICIVQRADGRRWVTIEYCGACVRMKRSTRARGGWHGMAWYTTNREKVLYSKL